MRRDAQLRRVAAVGTPLRELVGVDLVVGVVPSWLVDIQCLGNGKRAMG